MHSLVEFLLARMAEDRAVLKLLDERFAARWVVECDATARIVELIAVGVTDQGSLAGCDVLLRLARPYDHHPDFRADWRLASATGPDAVRTTANSSYLPPRSV